MIVTIVINAIGLFLILFFAGWFWWRRDNNESVVQASKQQPIEIVVANGVYQPEKIAAKLNEKIVLRFIRKDDNPCAATVIFPDFDQSVELPVNQPTDIELTPKKTGEFEFTCQMAMYRGKLVVTDAFA